MLNSKSMRFKKTKPAWLGALGSMALTAGLLTASAPVQAAPQISSGLIDDVQPGSARVRPAHQPVVAGNKVFYVDETLTPKLYVTKGTTGTTKRLFEGEIIGIAGVGNRVYFAGDGGDGAGIEMWTSDGTVGGTRRITDLAPGPASGIGLRIGGSIFGELRKWLLFRGTDAALYRVTRSGASKVPGLPPGSSTLYGIGDGKKAFAVVDTSGGDYLLYEIYLNKRSQPVATKVKTAGSSPSPVEVIGPPIHTVGTRSVFFGSGHGGPVTLYGSVGTGRVRPLLGAFPDAEVSEGMWKATSKVYFFIDSPATGRELYVTDGTPAGTKLVKDIHPGPSGSDLGGDVVIIGNTIFFAANDGSSGRELWKSKGTPGSTKRVLDLVPGPAGSYPELRFSAFGKVYFSAEISGGGSEAFVTDGTAAGTRSAGEPWSQIQRNYSRDIFAPDNYTTRFKDGYVFFYDDGTHGTELWRARDTKVVGAAAKAPKKAKLKKSGAKVKVKAKAGEPVTVKVKAKLHLKLPGGKSKKIGIKKVSIATQGPWKSKKLALGKKQYRAFAASIKKKARIKIGFKFKDNYGNIKKLKKSVKLK